jgi:colicin import membrane protein
MIITRSYRSSFIAALALHLSILLFFLIDKANERPVVTNSAKVISSSASKEIAEKQARAIKAVTVDSKEVMEEINRLKNNRARQKKAELDRQRMLKNQADLSRKKLIAEQNRIAAMKREAAKLALAKKKQLAEDKKHAEEMSSRKKAQEKSLADLKQKQLNIKNQQELEAKKLAEIKNKNAAELARIERAKEEKIKAELAKKEQEEADRQAALDRKAKAQMAGVVDKYKALIINAISRQWILPDNADSRMSSQFRIRLAPNGAVLDVSLTKSSGDSVLDRSARAAIYKASPLPVPTDPSTFNIFRDISLTVRPVNARG